MSKGWIIALVTVGILVFSIFLFSMFLVGTYNTMVTLNESVETSWSQVENQYQRRIDLIPNLVNVVKGYAAHEKETFTAITEARSKVGQINISAKDLNNPMLLKKFQAAQDGLSSALSRLMVVMENYPELKANENFMDLQHQLEGTENRISVERRKFNKTVQQYNTKIKRFPTNMMAGMFGFESKAYFKSQDGSDVAPKIEF